eukprot:COSAG02_NODE_5068_length_4672_cov_2.469932_2_plen_60_part_00
MNQCGLDESLGCDVVSCRCALLHDVAMIMLVRPVIASRLQSIRHNRLGHRLERLAFPPS